MKGLDVGADSALGGYDEVLKAVAVHGVIRVRAAGMGSSARPVSGGASKPDAASEQVWRSSAAVKPKSGRGSVANEAVGFIC